MESPPVVSIFLNVVHGISKFLTGTTAGQRPLGRPRHRWENNIRMDIK